jgi:hypothetical protein
MLDRERARARERENIGEFIEYKKESTKIAVETTVKHGDYDIYILSYALHFWFVSKGLCQVSLRSLRYVLSVAFTHVGRFAQSV